MLRSERRKLRKLTKNTTEKKIVQENKPFHNKNEMKH